MSRNTPSTIDRLPAEIRELIGDLRRKGRTIDEIKAKLDELSAEEPFDAPSRSALGRHVKGLAEIAERMRHSRTIAESLVSQFGEQPDNKLQRVNLELMHGVVMQTITAAEIDPETGEAQPVTFKPEDAMFLARSLQSLASAQKTDADRFLKAEERARKEAAEKAGSAAKAKGLGQETVDFITSAVLGVS